MASGHSNFNTNGGYFYGKKKISLPAKFDGTRYLFRDFLNQVRWVIQLHPNRYPIEVARVGLAGTLLRGTALAQFAPLVENKSPLLEDFEAFVKEFRDSDSIRTAINKIQRLRQGDHLASTYAIDFLASRSLSLSYNILISISFVLSPSLSHES